jgi:hypothetical protein
MPTLETLARLTAPWNHLYSNSKFVSTTVTTVHVVALLVAGGLAIAADRATLRADAEDAHRVARDIGTAHRPVLIALAILFVSGTLLAAADVETFATSPVFWVKLGLVALLLANGAGVVRAERAWERANSPINWVRMRRHAIVSLALWLATTVAGTVLVNAA